MSSPPRYDSKITRAGGFMWASECDLGSLEYWFNRFSSSSDPKYEAKDRDRAKKLSYWVKFREADPYSRWKGIRRDGEVVAAQPSAKPTIHSWDGPKTEPAPPPERGDAYEGGDDDVPNW